MTKYSSSLFSPEGIKVDLKENGIEENGSSEQYKKLLDLGLVEQVAEKLDSIYSEGLVKVFFSEKDLNLCFVNFRSLKM